VCTPADSTAPSTASGLSRAYPETSAATRVLLDALGLAERVPRLQTIHHAVGRGTIATVRRAMQIRRRRSSSMRISQT